MAIWVEYAHFVSYHLACYPNPNPNPNSNLNPNPNSNSNSNPKLGGLFHKMCKRYLFSLNMFGTAFCSHYYVIHLLTLVKELYSMDLMAAYL